MIRGASLATMAVLAGGPWESRSSGLAPAAESAPPLPGYRACDAYRHALAAHGTDASFVRQVHGGHTYAMQASRTAEIAIACVASNSLHQVGLTTSGGRPAGTAAWFDLVARAVASLKPGLAPDEVQALVSVLRDGAGAKARQNLISKEQYIGDDHITLQDYSLHYTVSARCHHFGIQSDKRWPSD
ncbi:hypothetical protein [Methylobacterium oryzisoli]|uniref:hypothetical protein n=1 Tax=Methylobacterium oryzisoli TaxID=3385502 RepID=UPI0038912A0D